MQLRGLYQYHVVLIIAKKIITFVFHFVMMEVASSPKRVNVNTNEMWYYFRHSGLRFPKLGGSAIITKEGSLIQNATIPNSCRKTASTCN
jgi:hypothetical protein